MNKGVLIALSLVLFCMASCSGDRLFEDFRAFESKSWNLGDSVSFDFEELKAEKNTKLIAIKFNENYPFSNCYVRVISQDSTGKRLDNRLINVPLFDTKSGIPLGEGFGNTFTKYDTLPIGINPAARKITFLHYMREQELRGVEAVGLKIIP